MSFTSRIILLLSLYTVIWRNVSGSILILDAFGRNVDSFEFIEGPFDDIPVMEGYIALTDPPDACMPVQEPSFLTNFTYFRFALIKGSKTCKNEEKIHNAAQAGFDFAIIFDPDYDLSLHLDSGRKFHIPTVLISLEDGLRIMRNYVYNNSSIHNYRVRIKLVYISYLILFEYLLAGAIGVYLLKFLFCMMVMASKKLFQIIEERRNKLSSRQINKQIPIAKFSKGDQYDVCAICLEDYNKGDKLRLLPCSHAYHAKCIDPWLINNSRSCPVCKRKIRLGDSDDESNSGDSELSSPAENTPLLTTPPNHGQSWGTFVNTFPTTNENDATAARPSSLPDSFSNPNNSNLRRPYTSIPVSADKSLVSDSESEVLLPRPRLSVNHERPGQSTDEAEVQVNPLLTPSLLNPSFGSGTTSNIAPSV